jgi:chorismate dehydratase
LIYGLKNSPVIDQIELITRLPANLAKDLLEGTIDLGLVPVAVYTNYRNVLIERYIA